MLGSFCEAPRSRVPLIARDEPPKRPTAPLRTHHERSSGGVPPNATALWVEIREVTHETSPGRVPRADRPHHRRHRGRVRLLGHRIGPPATWRTTRRQPPRTRPSTRPASRTRPRAPSRAAKRASPRRPASAKARSIKPSSSSTSTDGKPPRCPPPPRPPAPSTVTPSASTAPSPPTTIPATSPSRSTARRSRSPSPKARRLTSPTSPTCSSVGSRGKRCGIERLAAWRKFRLAHVSRDRSAAKSNFWQRFHVSNAARRRPIAKLSGKRLIARPPPREARFRAAKSPILPHIGPPLLSHAAARSAERRSDDAQGDPSTSRCARDGWETRSCNPPYAARASFSLRW